MVVTISPKKTLYKRVVLPEASNPTIKALHSVFLKRSLIRRRMLPINLKVVFCVTTRTRFCFLFFFLGCVTRHGSPYSEGGKSNVAPQYGIGVHLLQANSEKFPETTDFGVLLLSAIRYLSFPLLYLFSTLRCDSLRATPFYSPLKLERKNRKKQKGGCYSLHPLLYSDTAPSSDHPSGSCC
jgi:hypothetical protein